MASLPPPLSEFGQAALALDGDLIQFESLSEELDRLSIDSDKGLDRALILLQQITEGRERTEAGMHALARTLQEVRTRNEKAEAAISAKTTAVQTRQQQAEQMFSRFKQLGDMVKQLDKVVAQLKERTAEAPLPAEETELTERVVELDSRLGLLVEEARKLVDEAHTANMQGLERGADSLRKSLSAARNRIKLFSGRSLH